MGASPPRQRAPKGNLRIGRGSRAAIGDSETDSSISAGRECERVLYHQESAAYYYHIRSYPASSLKHTRTAMSHPRYGPLRGAALTPSLNKIISEEFYVKVAEGRCARCPTDGESYASERFPR